MEGCSAPRCSLVSPAADKAFPYGPNRLSRTEVYELVAQLDS